MSELKLKLAILKTQLPKKIGNQRRYLLTLVLNAGDKKEKKS